MPQFVRKQIADEVRAQVMDGSTAGRLGRARRAAGMDQTHQASIGDLRVRYESDLFDRNNDNQFTNFNAINDGSAVRCSSLGDRSGPGVPPFLNTTQDRTRFRLRARFGVQAQIDDWVSGSHPRGHRPG